jgi:hypothetical protein
MMICPQAFYDTELNGKTAQQILTIIRRLRQEIGRLKSIVEHPDYVPVIQPSERVRIACLQEYLDKAKEAYAKAGGVYEPSAAEMRADSFEKSLSKVNRIEFSIGGHFVGWEDRTYTVLDKSVRVGEKHLLLCDPIGEEKTYEIDKDEFFDELRRLRIGEWRKKYSPDRYGILVMDGTSWTLDLYYRDRNKPVRIQGDNAYPYNFDKLLSLFNVESTF